MFSVSNIIFATTFCNRACVGFLAFIRNYESPLYAHITLVSNTLVSNTRLRKQASVRIACDDWIIIFFVGVCFWWTFAWRQMSWRGVTNLMISIICLCAQISVFDTIIGLHANRSLWSKNIRGVSKILRSKVSVRRVRPFHTVVGGGAKARQPTLILFLFSFVFLGDKLSFKGKGREGRGEKGVGWGVSWRW